MNTSVFYATLVCLAIASGANCKISENRRVENTYDKESASKFMYYTMNRKPSANYLSYTNENAKVISLKEKCRENSIMDEAYEIYQRGIDQFKRCLNTRNITEIIRKLYEIEVPDIIETDGSIFNSACQKMTDWKRCADNYFEPLRECLNYAESNVLSIAQEVASEIGLYLCSDGANRITRFVISGGLDCVLDRQYGIKKCFDTNSLTRITGPISNDSLFNNIKFNKEQCNDFRQIQYCIENELSQCNDLTASNLVNAISELIFIHSPCLRYKHFYKHQKIQ